MKNEKIREVINEIRNYITSIELQNLNFNIKDYSFEYIFSEEDDRKKELIQLVLTIEEITQFDLDKRIQKIKQLENQIENLKTYFKNQGMNKRYIALVTVNYLFLKKLIDYFSIVKIILNKNIPNSKNLPLRAAYFLLYENLSDNINYFAQNIIDKFTEDKLTEIEMEIELWEINFHKSLLEFVDQLINAAITRH
jgi:uncharacterized protein HemX